jgi:uncharacterized protein YjbI with pentapeptide repeats
MKPKILLATVTLLATSSLSLPARAENIEHTRQLLASKQCNQCQLSNAGLVMADLSGAKLIGADLSRANLSRANLSGADLRGANLMGASLNGVNLMGADLTGANLTGVDLRDAYLVNANFTGVNLTTAYLQGAIGIPGYAGTAEDFYRWGVSEAEKANYPSAIELYTQALMLDPNLGVAYLARAVARYRLGDEGGATQDAQLASNIFVAKKNNEGYLASQNLLKGMELARNPSKVTKGGGNFMNFLGGVGSLLLQLFL